MQGGPVNFIKQIALGNHLTKLTNIFERIEATRATMFIGAGGGIESLPQSEQASTIAELERRIAALRYHPRHVITQELCKNMRVSLQLGRSDRLLCQQRLLDVLVANDAAMDIDTFALSFA